MTIKPSKITWETEYRFKELYYNRKFDIMWNTNRYKYSILHQKHLKLLKKEIKTLPKRQIYKKKNKDITKSMEQTK